LCDGRGLVGAVVGDGAADTGGAGLIPVIIVAEGGGDLVAVDRQHAVRRPQSWLRVSIVADVAFGQQVTDGS
jgi:hypothetical protein